VAQYEEILKADSQVQEGDKLDNDEIIDIATNYFACETNNKLSS
jgi:hypothetical protein